MSPWLSLFRGVCYVVFSIGNLGMDCTRLSDCVSSPPNAEMKSPESTKSKWKTGRLVSQVTHTADVKSYSRRWSLRAAGCCVTKCTINFTKISYELNSRLVSRCILIGHDITINLRGKQNKLQFNNIILTYLLSVFDPFLGELAYFNRVSKQYMK